MKKILVVSYFSPPCARSGVHRILRMAEYLPQFGWEPIFLTVRNGYWSRYYRIDERLNNLVKPFKTYKTSYLFPFKKGGNSLFKRLARRIWGEIMIPDGYVAWVPFAVKQGIKIIRDERPEAIFVTGTPFSSFLIGYFLKKKTGLPLFLDYRDPWTDNKYSVNRWKDFLCKYLEYKILKIADLAFAATPHMMHYILKGKNRIFVSRFRVLTYSFSKRHFNFQLDNAPNKNDDKFTVTYAGAGGFGYRPANFFCALKLLTDIHPDLANKIKFNSYGSFVGLSDKVRIAELIRQYKLDIAIELLSFLPYRDVLERLRNANILLLPLYGDEVTKVVYPGKFFDYLGVRRPILYLGPKGQVWETIEKAKTGICVDPENPEEIAEAIYGLYQKYYVRKEPFTPDEKEIMKFESEHVIGQFVKDIEEVLKN